MGCSLYYICYIWLVCNLLVKNVSIFRIHADDERSLKNILNMIQLVLRGNSCYFFILSYSYLFIYIFLLLLYLFCCAFV